MTEDEQLGLVEQHAPIVWLHEREVFLPGTICSLTPMSVRSDGHASYPRDSVR
jgi:hypothetical protein